MSLTSGQKNQSFLVPSKRHGSNAQEILKSTSWKKNKRACIATSVLVSCTTSTTLESLAHFSPRGFVASKPS